MLPSLVTRKPSMLEGLAMTMRQCLRLSFIPLKVTNGQQVLTSLKEDSFIGHVDLFWILKIRKCKNDIYWIHCFKFYLTVMWLSLEESIALLILNWTRTNTGCLTKSPMKVSLLVTIQACQEIFGYLHGMMGSFIICLVELTWWLSNLHC